MKSAKKIKKRPPQKPRRETPGQAFEKLVAVMARLRAPGGCPWDREQTHATLRTYLIEEAYEVLEALDASNDEKLPEELGDLLLQVLFHAQIASEASRFSISDVIREIHDKMIRRHPHVFSSGNATNSAEVLRNWERIKAEERASKAGKPGSAEGSTRAEQSLPESVLSGIPRGLPALLEGYQLTRKAARVGFDWQDIDGIFDKLAEETSELRDALGRNRSEEIEGELGDILFVAVNLARFLKIDPEIAMAGANSKFKSRFEEMERIARENRTAFGDLPRDQMESLWDQSKRNLGSRSKAK